jgi:hypothetical protein
MIVPYHREFPCALQLSAEDSQEIWISTLVAVSRIPLALQEAWSEETKENSIK